MEGFNEHNRVSRCISTIDGIHIPIKALRQHYGHYIIIKGFHSTQLQVVCVILNVLHDRLFPP